MTKIGEFHIESILEITERGIVLVGRIKDGIFSIGNYVEITKNSQIQRFKIIGIEGIRHSNPENIDTGLVLESMNEKEKVELKKSKDILKTVNIYNEEIKLSDLVSWLSTKSINEKLLFNELLLSDVTTMNRAIWSDENTSDNSKVESLKWSNELSHRIWNIIFDLKRKEDNESEKKLCESINFYAKQSSELSGHLGATIKLTIDRYHYINEKKKTYYNTVHKT